MSSTGPTHLNGNQVVRLISELVEHGIIHEELYELLCRLAYVLLEKRWIQKKGASLQDQAHQLAIDLLLQIRRQRMTHLKTAQHLSRELGKLLTRQENPVGHTLWTLLSEALLQMEKEGRVVRVSASGNINRQDTEWSLTELAENPSANVEKFIQAAAKLPVYYPTRQDGRLLSPTQARELLMGMLGAAGGPILMQELHSEALKHVVHTMLYEEALDEVDSPEQGGSEGMSRTLISRQLQSGYIIEDEALKRAETIWKKLEAKEDNRVLCNYYLPKFLLGKAVTGSDLGSPQRISEASKRIREVFQEAVDLTQTVAEQREQAQMQQFDPLASYAPNYALQLLRRITELLMKKCSEKSWDKHLNQ